MITSLATYSTHAVATSDPHHARKQTKADDTYAKKHTRRLEEVESSHDESERPHKQRRPGFYVFS